MARARRAYTAEYSFNGAARTFTPSQRAYDVMPQTYGAASQSYSAPSESYGTVSQSYSSTSQNVSAAVKTEPKTRPERVKRTRQRPQIHMPQPAQVGQSGTLSPAALRTLVAAVLVIGLLFAGMVLVNAHEAKLQYSINQLKNQNRIMETEVTMLNLEVDEGTSIDKLEGYAVDELEMHYAAGRECIRLADVEVSEGSLAATIRQKAYE